VFDSPRADLGELLVRAGKRLSYRGYDSVGCAAIGADGAIELRKDAGKIEDVNRKLKFDELSGKRGMIQLRWATFGAPTHENSQPHLSLDGKMVGAHNGNITNTPFLIEKLTAEGMTFLGVNDGEVVLRVIEKFINEGKSLKEAHAASLELLEGHFSCIAARSEDGKMSAFRNGSSLFLGIGEGFVCASSDLPSILEFTDEYIQLQDGDYVEFTSRTFEIFNLFRREAVDAKPVKSQFGIEDVQKGNFPHFMLKEIHEQEKTVPDLLTRIAGSKELSDFASHISKARRLYMTGAGSSFHSLLFGCHCLSRLARIPAVPCYASQFLPLYGPSVSKEDTVVLVSQSGETKDLLDVLWFVKDEMGGDVLSVVNNIGSTIALNSNTLLPLTCNLEISVPATKTFLNQVVLFLYLACHLNKLHGDAPLGAPAPADFNGLGELIARTIDLCDEPMRKLAGRLLPHKEFYILGFGLTYPIALEGALKVKEVVFNHPEGMYSSEFKHGPLAVVAPGYPVLYTYVSGDENYVLSHMNEVKCRQGTVIAFGPANDLVDETAETAYHLPEGVDNPYIQAILLTIPFQLLAYHQAVLVGNNPDQPRNLSKTLTVY